MHAEIWERGGLERPDLSIGAADVKAMLSSQPGAKDNSDTNSVPICVMQMSAKKTMLSSQQGAKEMLSERLTQH